MTQNDQPIPSGDGAVAEDTARSSDPEVLRVQVDEANRKAAEYLDQLQRKAAELINYRRRMEAEKAQWAKDASLDVLLKLLPIVDDFERALASADPKDLESGWGKGVALIERNLRTLLSNEGVERIDAEGAEFNPWEHDAVTYLPTNEAEEGSIVQVIRPGYRRGDRVVRPAQVIVARRPQ